MKSLSLDDSDSINLDEWQEQQIMSDEDTTANEDISISVGDYFLVRFAVKKK